MPIQSRTTIKNNFRQYERPEQTDYHNWIDSFIHQEEDRDQLNALIQSRLEEFRDQFFDRTIILPFYPEVITRGDFEIIEESEFSLTIEGNNSFKGFMKLQLPHSVNAIESIDFLGNARGFFNAEIQVVKNQFNTFQRASSTIVTSIVNDGTDLVEDLSTYPKEDESRIVVDPANEALTISTTISTSADGPDTHGRMSIIGLRISVS